MIKILEYYNYVEVICFRWEYMIQNNVWKQNIIIIIMS